MSYALRNTIILLVTLFIIIGGEWAYIQFFQKPELEKLEESLQQKQSDLNSKLSIVSGYEDLVNTYERAVERIESYDKALYESNNPDDVYDYLNKINTGNSFLTYDYLYSDSIIYDQYGAITSDLSGSGSYASLVNFINKLENSKLINKVSNVNISSAGTPENYNEVSFSFTLNSLYERVQVLEDIDTENIIRTNPEVSTYNPFYPLIRDTFEPNDEGLLNVETSRLVGLSGNKVFAIDQNGNLVTLREGDRVYLGTLQSIDITARTATFQLNKGGIIESITLEVQQ